MSLACGKKVNTFTILIKRKDQAVDGKRGPGRPPGRTARGEQTRQQLYEAALALFGEQGYEATTMRQIADRAGVSSGLLYKYFEGKRDMVLTLYDQLTAAYAERAATLPPGSWGARFMHALRTTLEVLSAHRQTLASLAGLLVADDEQSLFANRTSASRLQVQQVFVEAVAGAADAPAGDLIEPLGALLYLAHLLIILWWLLDKSPDQRATAELLDRIEAALPMASMMVRMPQAADTIVAMDRLVRDALIRG
jgi:AcrR family transcriptional regulator